MSRIRQMSRRLQFQSLEGRAMMAGDLFSYADVRLADRWNIPDLEIRAPIVPAMHSNPGAEDTIYLDFDGNVEPSWRVNNGTAHNVVTPQFDLDGDVSGPFSAEEWSAIEEIWRRVSEDFAPFDVNVTTVEPDSFANGEALRVAVGGLHSDWLAAHHPNPVSGIAQLGSYTNDEPNVVFVFSDEVDPSPDYGVAQAVANIASHEAGHAMGLRHHPLLASGAAGFVTAEEVIDCYHPGNDERTPIMGHSFTDNRTTWWQGPVLMQEPHHCHDPNPNNHSGGDGDDTAVVDVDIDFDQLLPTELQDDMAKLASVLGYRADDHGEGIGQATPLNVPDVTLGNPDATFGETWELTASGIIHHMNDVDGFTFATDGGPTRLAVNVVQAGPNLDAMVELWKLGAGGISRFSQQRKLIHVATADDADSLDAEIYTELTSGVYFVKVASHGDYGDVGQYTLEVGSTEMRRKLIDDGLRRSQYPNRYTLESQSRSTKSFSARPTPVTEANSARLAQRAVDQVFAAPQGTRSPAPKTSFSVVERDNDWQNELAADVAARLSCRLGVR